MPRCTFLPATAAALTLLASTVVPALADWGEPYCDRVANGIIICMTSQAMSGGRSGASQWLSVNVVREVDGRVHAAVAITDNAWSMPVREGLHAWISVDAQAPIKATARTVERSVVVDLSLNTLGVLQRARVVHVTLQAFAESYDLAGSRRAIMALTDAFSDYEGANVRTSDPFAGAVPAQPPATRTSDPFASVVRRST